jgi:hypothetical protein
VFELNVALPENIVPELTSNVVPENTVLVERTLYVAVLTLKVPPPIVEDVDVIETVFEFTVNELPNTDVVPATVKVPFSDVLPVLESVADMATGALKFELPVNVDILLTLKLGPVTLVVPVTCV